MPGPVPSTLLAYPNGGVDGIGGVISAVYNYMSPFLTSGLATKDAIQTTRKNGEQFTVTSLGQPGSDSQGQNFLTAPGFAFGITRVAGATAIQKVSTANVGSTDTAVIPDYWARGYQGSMYNSNANQYLNPQEELMRNQINATIAQHVSIIAQDADKAMFQQIYGNNYVSLSAADGTALTNTTNTYADDLTHNAYNLVTDLLSTTVSGVDKAVSLETELSGLACNRDANGNTIDGANQFMYMCLPDFFLPAINAQLKLLTEGNRNNVFDSDATFNYVKAQYYTRNSYTMIPIPYDWFYTVSGSTNNSYICPVMAPSAISWYMPRMAPDLRTMIMSFTALPGFTNLDGSPEQIASMIMANNPSLNISLTPDEEFTINEKYADPSIRAIMYGILSRYSPGARDYYLRGMVDPLSYGFNFYRMPPSSAITTSYQTAMQVTRFAGSVRAQPQYLIQLNIDPTLISASPPVYSNPYSATYAAFNSMSPEAFEEFAWTHKNAVKTDLDKENKHYMLDEKYAQTTRDIIERVHGKGVWTKYKQHATTPLEERLPAAYARMEAKGPSRTMKDLAGLGSEKGK